MLGVFSLHSYQINIKECAGFGSSLSSSSFSTEASEIKEKKHS